MREICNLSYAKLAQGRNQVEMADLETMLTPPEDKQAAFDRINAESMAQLGMGQLIPMPKRKP